VCNTLEAERLEALQQIAGSRHFGCWISSQKMPAQDLLHGREPGAVSVRVMIRLTCSTGHPRIVQRPRSA